MFPIDTRTAAQHRRWRYVELAFKTVAVLSGFVGAYFVLTYGF